MSNAKNKRDGSPNAKSNAAHQNGERKRGRGKFEEIEWGFADAELLKRCIVALTRSKCAIQFGKTLNGDSLTIRIVGDGEPFVEYCRPSGDIAEWLISIALDYEL